MKNKYLYIVFLLVALFGVFGFSTSSMHAQDKGLSASAPNVVAVDEVFQIVFTSNGKAKDFKLPNMEDFHILAGPSTSTMSSTSYVNGKRTHVYQNSFTYVAQCSKEGKFVIPSATVIIDGKKYSSDPILIEVIKNASKKTSNSNNSSEGASSGNSLSADDLFIILDLSKTNVIMGEPIVATIKLYTDVNIAGFEDIHFPTFNGFWNQELDSPSQVEFVRENYNGKIYSAALLKKYILIPQQSGKIKIDPAELVCAVQVQSSSRGSSIFDDFFGSYQTLKKKISTSSKTINVSGLPLGAPSSFSGAVGSYSLDVSTSKNDMSSHDAASLYVTISGSGNLNMINVPKINFPPDFEVYDVKKTDKIRTSANGVSGKRVFEYPFIPRSSGNFILKPVEFSYYDLDKKRYITLKSDEKELNISKGKNTDAVIVSSGVNRKTVSNLGEDIRFLSNNVNSLNLASRPLISSYLYYLLMLLVALVLGLAIMILDKKIERNKDVVKVRNRKASKVAKARLKGAGLLLKQGLTSAFYEELHKALFCYVADKLMLPVAEINRNSVEEKFLELGKSNELIAELFAIVDACEYARYAPSDTPGAMETQYQDAINVISKMEA